MHGPPAQLSHQLSRFWTNLCFATQKVLVQNCCTLCTSLIREGTQQQPVFNVWRRKTVQIIPHEPDFSVDPFDIPLSGTFINSIRFLDIGTCLEVGEGYLFKDFFSGHSVGDFGFNKRSECFFVFAGASLNRMFPEVVIQNLNANIKVVLGLEDISEQLQPHQLVHCPSSGLALGKVNNLFGFFNSGLEPADCHRQRQFSLACDIYTGSRCQIWIDQGHVRPKGIKKRFGHLFAKMLERCGQFNRLVVST